MDWQKNRPISFASGNLYAKKHNLIRLRFVGKGALWVSELKKTVIQKGDSIFTSRPFSFINFVGISRTDKFTDSIPAPKKL